MADKYASATTYNYAFNNPVVLNDPMGDDPNNPARGFQWWRYNQNGTPRDKGMQDAHAGGMAQQGGMYGSGYASSKSLSSLVNYLLNHTTEGGTWQNGMYRIFTSSTDAYTSAVGWGGPQIYNYFCDCMVNAHDVLATDPTNQNKNFRAWAQAAVNIYNTRAQLNNGTAEAQAQLQANEPDSHVGIGMDFSIGGGVLMQGLEFHIGGYGAPGSRGQAYFSVGIPKYPIYVNASVGAQFLFVKSRGRGNIDLSGKGVSGGIGMGPVGASYGQSLGDDGEVTADVYGVGTGAGLKYSGGITGTKTWTLEFFSMPLMTLIPKF